jgi:hypothetical protein
MLLAGGFSGLLDHLMDVLLSKKLVVLDMCQHPPPLLLNNPRHNLL